MKKIIFLLTFLILVSVDHVSGELKIVDNQSTRIRLGNTTAGGSFSVLLGSDTGSFTKWGTVENVSAGNMNFQSLSHTFKAGGFSSPVTALVITSSGFVGVNTSSPAKKLDINGSAYVSNFVQIAAELKVGALKDDDGTPFFNGGSCANGAIGIAQDGTLSCASGVMGGDVIGPASSRDDSIVFFDGSTGKLINEVINSPDGYASRLRVDGNGNLVINTDWRDKIHLKGIDSTAGEENEPHTVLLVEGSGNVGFRIWESSVGNLLSIIPPSAGQEHEIDLKGELDLNSGITGAAVALRINGEETLWYNSDYFSWGFGGDGNYFPDNIGIKTSTPAYTVDVVGTVKGNQLCISGGCLASFGPADDHIADGHINMNDYEVRNIRALQLKDWDDDTGGTDNKYRVLGRDHNAMFYNGGVVVGNYANGTWTGAGELPAGKLIVEDSLVVGSTANPAPYELYLGASGNDLEVAGNLNVNGQVTMTNGLKPIYMVTIVGTGAACHLVRNPVKADFLESEWHCEANSFYFYNGDIQENGTVNPAYFETCTKNGKWYAYFDFASHNNAEEFAGSITCFNKNIMDWEYGHNAQTGVDEWYGHECSAAGMVTPC